MVGWRVHYADGSRVDSSEAVSNELPDGVVGVVEFLEGGARKIVCGADWYWRENGRWRTSDTVWGGWVERPRSEAIRGAGLPDRDWRARHRAMLEDRRCP